MFAANTSEEAKQHSKEVLENNDLSGAGKNDEDKNTGNASLELLHLSYIGPSLTGYHYRLSVATKPT